MFQNYQYLKATINATDLGGTSLIVVSQAFSLGLQTNQLNVFPKQIYERFSGCVLGFDGNPILATISIDSNQIETNINGDFELYTFKKKNYLVRVNVADCNEQLKEDNYERK